MTTGSIIVVVLLLSLSCSVFSMEKGGQVSKHKSLAAVLRFITAQSAVTAFCTKFLAMLNSLHPRSTTMCSNGRYRFCARALLVSDVCMMLSIE